MAVVTRTQNRQSNSLLRVQIVRAVTEAGSTKLFCTASRPRLQARLRSSKNQKAGKFPRITSLIEMATFTKW